MEAVIESKKTIAQLIEPVTIYPQLMKNVPVRDKKEAQQDADVKAVIAEVEASLGDNGRVLVRESGTEPVVRVMVEADTDDQIVHHQVHDHFLPYFHLHIYRQQQFFHILYLLYQMLYIIPNLT